MEESSLGFTSNECVAHLRVVGLIYQGLMRVDAGLLRGCCENRERSGAPDGNSHISFHHVCRSNTLRRLQFIPLIGR